MTLHKSSRLVTVIRAVGIMWAVIWLFFHVLPLEGSYYVRIWSTWWFSLAVAVVLVLRIGAICYLIDMMTYSVLYGNDPAYQEARRNGWHPFWDNIPEPIKPGGFVPPNTWQFCCPVCNSRVEKAVDICWHCGYGSDGNSDAYHQRYGYPNDDNPDPSTPVTP